MSASEKVIQLSECKCSRVFVDIPYDLLAPILGMTDGMRIIQARCNDERGILSALVEGRRGEHNYPWRPGQDVPRILVYRSDDIPGKLLDV